MTIKLNGENPMLLTVGCIEPDGRVLIEQEGQRIIIPAHQVDSFISNMQKYVTSDTEEADLYFEMNLSHE